MIIRGHSLLVLGRTEEALADLTDALAKYRATGAVTVVPLVRTWFAEALGKAGRPTEGLEQLDEAERQIEATQERWTEADMYRVRGELLITVGDPVSAEKCLQKAIAVARGQSAKLWEVRAATCLARLWRDQGKRAEARDLLAPIYGWFTEGFDTPFCKRPRHSSTSWRREPVEWPGDFPVWPIAAAECATARPQLAKADTAFQGASVGRPTEP